MVQASAYAGRRPYAVEAPLLPQTLGEAVDALEASDVYRAAFGDPLIDYLVMMKRSEIEVHANAKDASAWEMAEYLYDLHLEPRPGGRYAFHWHDQVPHRHCVEPSLPRPDHHYEGAFFDDIGWAATELATIAGAGISCRGLRSVREVP